MLLVWHSLVDHRAGCWCPFVTRESSLISELGGDSPLECRSRPCLQLRPTLSVRPVATPTCRGSDNAFASLATVISVLCLVSKLQQHPAPLALLLARNHRISSR